MKLKEKRIKIRNKIIKVPAKLQITMLICVIVICTGIGFIINFNNKNWNIFPSFETKKSNISNEAPTPIYEFISPTFSKESTQTAPSTPTPTPTPKIYVHVSGAVQNPGLVSLNVNSRVNDAIKAAGGITKKANLDIINLAEYVYDGTKIHIPVVGETPTILHSTNHHTSQTPAKETSANSTEPQKVNINTATMDELMMLNGIGLSTAQNIIDYRETNGNYKSIEDILNVSGIGDAKFNKIKNFICV